MVSRHGLPPSTGSSDGPLHVSMRERLPQHRSVDKSPEDLRDLSRGGGESGRSGIDNDCPTGGENHQVQANPNCDGLIKSAKTGQKKASKRCYDVLTSHVVF